VRVSISLLTLILTIMTGKLPVAAQNGPLPDVREMARKVMMPIVYQVPGMDKVKVVQNLKYTKTDDPNVLLDLICRRTQRPARNIQSLSLFMAEQRLNTRRKIGVFTRVGLDWRLRRDLLVSLSRSDFNTLISR
jgi:hypothetical protein